MKWDLLLMGSFLYIFLTFYAQIFWYMTKICLIPFILETQCSKNGSFFIVINSQYLGQTSLLQVWLKHTKWAKRYILQKETIFGAKIF